LMLGIADPLRRVEQKISQDELGDKLACFSRFKSTEKASPCRAAASVDRNRADVPVTFFYGR